MTEIEFNKQYSLAIQKTAIGIYLFNVVYDEFNQEQRVLEANINGLCKLLADNIGVNQQTVKDDALQVYNNLPVAFIAKCRDSGMLEDLLKEFAMIGFIIGVDK